MADETRRVQGTVRTTNEDSKYQDAMDLANKISYAEQGTQKDRNYWLSLYAQCWHVVSYGSLKE